MKIIISLTILSLLYACYSHAPEIKTGLEGKPMPEIDMLGPDGMTHFNTNSIAPVKPTLLFAFEPWCPYCRAQTKAIISHIESLKGINIYMLCGSTLPEFKKFYAQYKLDKYPAIKAGVDLNRSFAKYFKTTSIPFLAIYGHDKKLKQVLRGKSYINTIKEVALN